MNGTRSTEDSRSRGVHQKVARGMTLGVLAILVTVFSLPAATPPTLHGKSPHFNQSDLNRDGKIDLLDVAEFSARYLGTDYREVDWGRWLVQGSVKQKHRELLIAYIREQLTPADEPEEDPWKVVNQNDYPCRLVAGPEGTLYVTDPQVGSVFVYGDSGLRIIGELKGLKKPMGVALDRDGNLYVGSQGNHRIEVYTPAGDLLRTMGDGELLMPTDMVFAEDGTLYVADSDRNRVWVFSPSGELTGHIGQGGDAEGDFRGPVSVAIGYAADPDTGAESMELYVADQGHSLIHVFGADGAHLRSFGGKPYKTGGWFRPTWVWQGRFMSLISLAIDTEGRLHTSDSFMNKVQILNPVTGAYITHYGETGKEDGQFRLPFDVCIPDATTTVVSDTLNKRIVVRTPAP